MRRKGYKIIVLLLLLGVFATGCHGKKSETLNSSIASEEKTVKEKTSEKKQKTEEQELVDSARENSKNGSERDVEQGVTVQDEFSAQTIPNNINDTTSVIQKNTTSSEKTESHTHTWVAQTQTVSHAEEGHYGTKVIQAAYDEEVYAWRTLCNRCTDPETGLPLDITGHAIDHVVIICGGGYYADRVVVDTIHHDAITEQVWVVDKATWTETITAGYKCSCGAKK